MEWSTEELRKRNNSRDAELSSENKVWMTQIVCYLREKHLEEKKLEDVRQDITDMLLEAQNRGDRAEGVFGGDYQRFCDEVLDSVKPVEEEQKLKENFGLFVTWLPFVGLLVSGFNAFFYMQRGRTWSWENLLLTLQPLLLYLALAVLLKIATRKYIPIHLGAWLQKKRRCWLLLGILFTGLLEVLFYMQCR